MAWHSPIMAETERAVWRWDEGVSSDIKSEFTQWVEGEGLQLALLPADKNIALGEIAKDDFGLRVPLTDG